MCINVCDHGRIRRKWVSVRQIHPRIGARFFVSEFLDIVHDFVHRGLDGAVRDGGGPHQEEWRRGIVLDEFFHLVVHQVAAVVLAAVIFIVCGVIFIQCIREVAALYHEVVSGLDFHAVFPEFYRVI